MAVNQQLAFAGFDVVHGLGAHRRAFVTRQRIAMAERLPQLRGRGRRAPTAAVGGRER